jgi:hypothetical protein
MIRSFFVIHPTVSPVRVSGFPGSGRVDAVRYADGVVAIVLSSISMEGKVLLDSLDVSVRHESGSTESAFALAALALKQVAFSLMTTQDLPCASDFEALGDGFPCFCFSSNSWHGARKLRNP